ncbi:GNAT family N-acetyltransferase [Intrasporangium calvum]|uniref:GNAT family N-acetyltransferase n=1 Tax=Intrasporangium calvum TaxID=53358 RepID=A0ABT5GMB9_9MICO|nr:GNAT family N-acetyltransferase [Intrasporangium calvum]MDC5699010.1 GNAT family N-acetyltransferase [Intrasporangium calvum]
MSADRPVPTAVRGDRVEVRAPTHADEAAYSAAVTRSALRLSEFAVPDPHNLPAIIASQSGTYRTFMIHALEPQGEYDLVGRANVANVVRGAFNSATIGYDAYDPYVGKGLFAEGLQLMLDLVFADEPAGMGLHRIEANIQPTNLRSAGLVRSLGFTHEGFSRDFLHLPGRDGHREWRDHDRYTMLASAWPAPPYRHEPWRRLAAVVAGPPALDAHGLASQLATELGLPLFSAAAVPTAATLFELLRASPVGGIVEAKLAGPELRMGLARARLDPAMVPVFEPLGDPTKREVVDRALRVRAAFGVRER